jgi:hypothetical protein
MYLSSDETNDDVFGMFAGRLAMLAQSEIAFALKTFVHEPAELRLANRAMQIAMDIAQTIACLKMSGC